MILHIDMDAFYAAIEQRDRPELRGRPVVVGGSSARGVVAAASYEARRFGIHSAMPGRRAAELCPDAVFVRSRIDVYASVGQQVREIFGRYTPLVQPLSLDEAFLDVAGSLRLFGSAEKIGREIKAAIQDELGLTASVGIAPLKFVAKIASDLRKPDGFVQVAADDVQAFLDPLPVSRLWGVGRVGQQKLYRKGIHKIADLRVRSLVEMKQSFGSWGEHLWRLSNGIDARTVVPDRTAKQIGHERTFHEDLTDPDMIRAVVSFLTEAVSRRLRSGGRQCRCVSIKYRRSDFRTFARSVTLPEVTDSTDQIFRAAMKLLETMRQQQPAPVRLIGVSLGSLTHRDAPSQLSLFDLTENESSLKKVDKVVDDLRSAIGDKAAYRATSHDWVNRKQS